MGKTDVARQSIEAVYRNNTGSLSRFLTRFLDSRVEIEDVLQEAFLKALEAERKTDIETPLPFLFKTARNLALNTIARYRRQRTDPITDFDELPVLMDLRLISNLNPESEALVDEQLRFASEAVEQLTPRVREVFILRKLYGLTHSVLKVDVTEGTVIISAISAGLEPAIFEAALPDARSHVVSAGQVARVGESINVVQTVEPTFIELQLAWRQGMLVFDGDPLESVIAEISRYTPVEIVMADPPLRSLKIGGYFRTGDTQFLLDTLSSSFGIEAEHIRPGLIYLRPMPR